jgi:hypothetical protein
MQCHAPSSPDRSDPRLAVVSPVINMLDHRTVKQKNGEIKRQSAPGAIAFALR